MLPSWSPAFRYLECVHARRHRGLFRARRTNWMSPRLMVTDDRDVWMPLNAFRVAEGRDGTEASPRRRELSLSAGLWTIASVACLGVGASWLLHGGAWTRYAASFLVALGMPAFVLLLHFFTLDRDAAARAVRRAIAAGSCPCCGYSLDGQPEADPATASGRVACAECGAIWAPEKWRRDAPPRTPRKRLVVRGKACDVRDDRGRTFTTTPEMGAPLLADRQRHEFSELVRWRHPDDTAALVVAALFVTAGAWVWITEAERSLATFFALCGAFVGLLLHLTSAHGRAMRRAQHGFIATGHCPACGEAMRTECSMVDGCRLCDACGAAWHDP